MIITLILDIIYNFLNFVFGLLNSALTFTGLQSGLQAFFSWVLQFNSILPIDTAYRFIGYAIDFWLAVFIFDFFKWIIHLVRGN